MTDFFEVDFLDVESDKSGDAIPLRYEVGGIALIHVVDGGFQDTGDAVVTHIRTYYGNPSRIDHVVVTHPDGDHAGGLRTVLESFDIGALWMLRPWLYAGELIDRFAKYSSVENLRKRLREVYPNLVALEDIAEARGIPILEPFQGVSIGAFTVMAPSRSRYLDLVVDSERTPEAVAEQQKLLVSALSTFVAEAVAFLKSAWGAEVFSPEETSAENEMSVVQYATLCNTRILLTGDAGRSALAEAADYAPSIGLILPGIDRFQVPHHGSRRNVSTELLDRWLGPRRAVRGMAPTFSAYISSAKKDEAHPRKAVVRAMIHRGASVWTTEGRSLCMGVNTKARHNWGPATPIEYPDEQEE
jgi:beta-lactamase superfamily II metal-dependent hydrolase